jgi:hypothetical protein
MDYDPLPMVKKYTLDQKVKDEMDGAATNVAGVSNNLQKDIDDKLQTCKERVHVIISLRRIIKEDKCDKEKSRFNELLKHLYPR